MFPSEKRSLRRFLTIYILSTLLLIAVGSGVFYRYAIHRIIDHQNERLKGKTAVIATRLRTLHNSQEATLFYPVRKGIHTALYDIDRHYLIGDFHPERIPWDQEFWQWGDRLYYRQDLYPYYLGAAYIIASTRLDAAPIHALQIKLALGFLLAVIFIVIIARWLGQIFLDPVHQAMTLLDRFIKDTTHELNTPVSTILTNIELYRDLHSRNHRSEELDRIETAARRLSLIYDDLAYLQLHHQRNRVIEKVDMSALCRERSGDFQLMARRRHIDLNIRIEEGVVLSVDRSDALKLIDNLLSNAIKYTHSGGEITLICSQRCLIVRDNGIGMGEQAIHQATQRYFRADDSEGGFGLGLSIIQEIVDFYGQTLRIKSKKGKGTEMEILWND